MLPPAPGLPAGRACSPAQRDPRGRAAPGYRIHAVADGRQRPGAKSERADPHSSWQASSQAAGRSGGEGGAVRQKIIETLFRDPGPCGDHVIRQRFCRNVGFRNIASQCLDQPGAILFLERRAVSLRTSVEGGDESSSCAWVRPGRRHPCRAKNMSSHLKKASTKSWAKSSAGGGSSRRRRSTSVMCRMTDS